MNDQVLIFHNNKWYILSNVQVTDVNSTVTLNPAECPQKELIFSVVKPFNENDKGETLF